MTDQNNMSRVCQSNHNDDKGVLVNGNTSEVTCEVQVHATHLKNNMEGLQDVSLDDQKLPCNDKNENSTDGKHDRISCSEYNKSDSSSVRSISQSSSDSSVYHDTASVDSDTRYCEGTTLGESCDSMKGKPGLDARVRHTVEKALQEIELSSEETRQRLGSDALAALPHKPETKSVCDENFIEVPLNSPSSRPAHSYAKTSENQRPTSPDSIDEMPSLGDVKPKQSSRVRTSSVKKAVSPKNSPTASNKEHTKISKIKKKPLKLSPDVQKKISLATSTTGLIFENRPVHLPPKLPKEEEKHRQQYDNMVENARKIEKRKVTKELKLQEKQKKIEENIGQLVGVWKTEVLPNWENVKKSKRVKEMWWAGLPPSVRGKVWKLALGNDLHITPELFQIFRAHAAERVKAQAYRQPVAMLRDSESDQISEISKENTVGLITLDVARTFPSLCIFQKGGPYHEPLKDLLGAYTCYRPDVGYVQGMSFLAAMLLLNMDSVDAFIAFTNLLNRPCQMAFFMVDQPLMNAYFNAFDALLEEHLPKLQHHFKQENLSHDIYLIDWIFTLYSKSLPLDVSCRVWDLFCRDGESFLFRTALGILRLYRNELVEMEFFHLAQYLTKLSSKFTADELFQSIATINFSKSKFNSLLQHFTSLLGRDR